MIYLQNYINLFLILLRLRIIYQPIGGDESSGLAINNFSFLQIFSKTLKIFR